MSHPVPGRFYGDEREGREPKKGKTIKDIKKMIEEPADKKWFKKHGMPKDAKSKAIKKRLFEGLDQGRGNLPPGYRDEEL